EEPTGRLTKKIHRQIWLKVTHPPRVGPIVGAMMAVMPYSAKAKPRCCGGKVSAKIAWAIGCSPPPPAPCRIRKRRRKPRLGAIPQSKELTVKTVKQAIKNRFRPKVPASQPLIGRMMAFETR